jgi:hypothetical protein
MTAGPCEGCERAAAEVVEPCDNPDEPYRLCGACHERLLARALRPLEWYNLARRHGWYMYLLHDSFYEQDCTVMAPEAEVVTPELFPAPVLADVAHSPGPLLGFTITRWSIGDELADAWRALDPSQVLDTLGERYASTRNAGIRGAILEVCALAVGPMAADFVRAAWGDYGQTVDLYSLARASAACLPFREGFDRVRAAVDALEPKEKRSRMFALNDFHSPEAIAWIEQNIFPPVTDAWGTVAAASRFDWPTAERWLASGRPLSLVALDALAAIIHPQRLPAAREPRARLHDPPDAHTLEAALTAYAQRDPVPRVESITRFLRQHVAALVETG